MILRIPGTFDHALVAERICAELLTPFMWVRILPGAQAEFNLIVGFIRILNYLCVSCKHITLRSGLGDKDVGLISQRTTVRICLALRSIRVKGYHTTTLPSGETEAVPFTKH